MLDHHLLFKWNGVVQIANPANHHGQFSGNGPYAAPTNRPANAADMTNTAREGLTALLDFLCDHCGYNEQQRKEAALTLGYAENELAEIHRAEAAGELPIDVALKRNTFVAKMVEAVIEIKFTVSDPVILGASEATLREWEANVYPLAVGKIYAELMTVQNSITTGSHADNIDWCKLREKLGSALGKFWQCRTRLSIDPFTGRVLNTDLSLLEQHESEHASVAS